LLQLLDNFDLLIETLVCLSAFASLPKHSVVVDFNLVVVDLYVIVLAVCAPAKPRASRSCIIALTVLFHASCLRAVASS